MYESHTTMTPCHGRLHLGWPVAKLDRKGDRIDARLDRKGSRVDYRLDRKGHRINRRN